MSPPRRSVEELIGLIPGSAGAACACLVADHGGLLRRAPGSGHNHQAWPGGYWDHLAEVMNLAVVLHGRLDELRPLPFALPDALLVLFVHDLEKPWRHQGGGEALAAKADKAAFRLQMIGRYGIRLTDEQANALRYVEGEGADYSPRRRAMGPLAAFCHLCDTASARLWPEAPAAADDPWPGAARSAAPG